MDSPLQILPTPFGLVLAAFAVALGAPIFSDGLRALRMRRQLRSLERAPLTESTGGFTHASGSVALDSPLFSPLSGEPCAAFQLEIEGEGRSVRRRVEVRRAFRIVDGPMAAQVPVEGGRWVFEATATRRIAADEPLSENLQALLGQVPEAVWLRRAGVPLQLTEYALLAGRECHVIGTARAASAQQYAESVDVVRTGTDDLPVMLDGNRTRVLMKNDAPLAFSRGEHLDFLLVTDRAPAAALLHVAPHRLAGVVLGPALTLAGILYLAAVADALRAGGRL